MPALTQQQIVDGGSQLLVMLAPIQKAANAFKASLNSHNATKFTKAINTGSIEVGIGGLATAVEQFTRHVNTFSDEAYATLVNAPTPPAAPVTAAPPPGSSLSAGTAAAAAAKPAPPVATAAPAAPVTAPANPSPVSSTSQKS